ncbi:MAG: penicillin-binding protein 2 [Candidatus Liptonbacteria bacterium]|nr:penicillin-binding protein 2 [Candidatus Liptonbacteria bacterium]
MKGRFLFLVVAIAGGYSFLFFQLYKIQITKGDYYLARAESQYISSGVLSAKRGTVYFSDKNGNKMAVAVEKDFPIVYAVPKVVDDAKETYNRLVQIISVLPQNIQKKLFDKNSSYVLLERRASQDVVDKVNEEKIKGIFVDLQPERFYPFGTLASHVLGFVGPNTDDNGESGKYGVEKLYEEKLNGVPGKTEEGKLIQPKSGDDLLLTIDQNIQKEGERILSDLVKNSAAKSGSFIVEEPSTGRILAMGGYPDFDPNNYSRANVSDFLNPVVQKIYEPGSVIKVITMAAGIDSGKITPQTTYFDNGFVIISGKRIENHDFKTRGGRGSITMTNVIENSLNTGAIFAESETGNETFRNYLAKFGLQNKTGIDLPGEISGSLKPLFASYIPQVNFATASFGQGIAVTPIELITAVSAIANSGQMMRPYVNAALEPKTLGQIVNSSTARMVTEMMISAVDKAGVAKLSGYTLAGKTGTANVPDFKNKTYTDNVINTYVGFAPAGNPRFIALMKLDEPQDAPQAATTVVPAFRELAQFILNYYNVPPDRF